MPLDVPLSVTIKSRRARQTISRHLRDVVYSKAIPGGNRIARIDLDRPLLVDDDAIQQYADLIITDGRHGGVVWQGRLEDPGRGTGRNGEIWSLAAVGGAAHAQDREVPLIYVDKDLDRWFVRSGSTRRVTTGREGQQDGALNFSVGLGENLGPGFNSYYAYAMLFQADQKLARVTAGWDSEVTDTDYLVELMVEDSVGAGTQIATATWNTAGGTLTGTKPSNWAGSDKYGARLGVIANGVNPPAVPSSSYAVIFDQIVIRTILKNASGADITTGYTVDYVLAHEIVKDVIGRLLPKVDGAHASINTTSTFQIDQLAYPDGATAFDVLNDLMGIEATFYWAIWEDDLGEGLFFEWRKWPTTVRYRTSARDGFDSPESVTELYNAVSVRWRSPAGKIRTTRRTQTVDALTSAGLTREEFIDAGDEVSSLTMAERIGDQFLAEHATQPNTGRLTVRSPVFDRDAGRLVEPWEIVPGHLIRVRDVQPRIDALNPGGRDGVTTFRVVETEYSAVDNACVLSLDSPHRRVSQIVGRRRRSRKR